MTKRLGTILVGCLIAIVGIAGYGFVNGDFAKSRAEAQIRQTKIDSKVVALKKSGEWQKLACAYDAGAQSHSYGMPDEVAAKCSDELPKITR